MDDLGEFLRGLAPLFLLALFDRRAALPRLAFLAAMVASRVFLAFHLLPVGPLTVP